MSEKIKKAKVEEVTQQSQRVRGTKHFKMPKEFKRLAATISDRAERRAFLNAAIDSIVNRPLPPAKKDKSNDGDKQ